MNKHGVLSGLVVGIIALGVMALMNSAHADDNYYRQCAYHIGDTVDWRDDINPPPLHGETWTANFTHDFIPSHGTLSVDPIFTSCEYCQ